MHKSFYFQIYFLACCGRMEFDFNNIFVVDYDMDSGGRKCGLSLLGKNSLNLTVLSVSLYHIDGVINDVVLLKQWRFTGVYGWPKEHLKAQTW